MKWKKYKDKSKSRSRVTNQLSLDRDLLVYYGSNELQKVKNITMSEDILVHPDKIDEKSYYQAYLVRLTDYRQFH